MKGLEMKIKKGLVVYGFCCKDYVWEIFDVTENTIYTKCANPNCENNGVFLAEFGEIEQLQSDLD